MLPDHVVGWHEDDVVHTMVGGVAAQQLLDDGLELWAGLLIQLDAEQVPGPVDCREEPAMS